MQLNLDFYSDWITFQKSELTRMGYDVPPALAPHKLSILFFNALSRRVTAKPRRILKSKQFTCPSTLANGLTFLEGKIRSGEDINSHLSRKIVNLDYNDALLNDWDIYHFHLGTKSISAGTHKGLIKGTKTVLLARVTESDFYSICTVDHATWADLNWIEILHANWPESIAKWKHQGISLQFIPDNHDILRLRRANINSPMQTSDGSVYSPFGGGYATDGSSAMAVLKANRHFKRIKQLEQQVRKSTALFLNDLKQLGYDETKPLTGKFTIDERGWYVLFPEWAYRIKLFAYDNPITS